MDRRSRDVTDYRCLRPCYGHWVQDRTGTFTSIVADLPASEPHIELRRPMIEMISQEIIHDNTKYMESNRGQFTILPSSVIARALIYY